MCTPSVDEVQNDEVAVM